MSITRVIKRDRGQSCNCGGGGEPLKKQKKEWASSPPDRACRNTYGREGAVVENSQQLQRNTIYNEFTEEKLEGDLAVGEAERKIER